MKLFKTPKGTELLITDIKGKDYLEVKYRLIWFREEKPDWSISTEFILQDLNCAFAKAVIMTPDSRIVATAHKYEDKAGFPDYREKAETGAIGRALALIGYGTQFTGTELEEGNRLVDSPTEPKRPPIAFKTDPSKDIAHCEICGALLKISKAGTCYYCPNFKQGAGHSRFPIQELAEYLAKQTTDVRDYPPSPFEPGANE